MGGCGGRTGAPNPLCGCTGSKDNCPPGGGIAHPSAKHPVAGGAGTAADPITFASEKRALLAPDETVILLTSPLHSY